ncbi:ATP-binding protein [Neptuniibacter sp. QD37_11]|uniref:ATP-binding protein n=1 Tax=Neptuniibacter sp. QD37_11 TaxID=3398209 RepID=UPI0039F58703
MEQNKNLIEVDESKIAKRYMSADSLLGKITATMENTEGDGINRSYVRGGSTGGGRTEIGYLSETITNITETDSLPTAVQNGVIRAIRRGLAIGIEVTRMFSQYSGADELQNKMKNHTATDNDRAELKELIKAQSIISGFVFANYLHHACSELGDASHDARADVPSRLDIYQPVDFGKQILIGLDMSIKNYAKDDADLLNTVSSYAHKLMDDLLVRREGMTHLDKFEACTYRVEADEFDIDGFNRATGVKAQKLVMEFKKPEEVIGNSVAKYQAQQQARILLAYDFKRRMNPFVELGGFAYTFMGDGNPGTGKTTLIQMMAGLLNEYCEWAGYPFVYQNLDSETIDSYQGKSAAKTGDFIRTVSNEGVIGFGTIDDIDQIAGKRGDKNSSVGAQEVTAKLMEAFAGTGTVIRGNCTFGMFSNYPENVDDALRQRAGARYLIDGPQTLEDYIDIFHLLIGRKSDMPIGDHDLFATQQVQDIISRAYEAHDKPHEDQLLKVYENTLAEVGGVFDTQAKVGRYLKNIQLADERFTGRAINNIKTAVEMRCMDFKMPDEWFLDNPETFVHAPWEQKMQMLADLRKPMTPEMIIQEINRYADSEFRYANKSDEAAIAEMVRNAKLQEQARNRLNNELKITTA